MKKVLVSIFSFVIFLSFSHPAAGQAGSSSLNDQLIQAAKNGDAATVQQLLARGTNIEAREDRLGHTPLIAAAIWGRVDVVKLLLEKGANVEARDSTDATALMRAAWSQGFSAEVVDLLLEKGANIEDKNKHGDTALIGAAGWGRVEAVRLLLQGREYRRQRCGRPNGPAVGSRIKANRCR